MPAAILALGWLVQWIYAFPGYGSADSLMQLSEARAHHYSDWHPPAMAVLWHYVEYVVAGPSGMLAVQITCALAGAYLVLRRHMSPRWAALIAGLVLWFPPIGSTMAVIWKDSQMTGFALLGAAWLLSERRWVKLAGLGMLMMATLMRHNGFTITFAIIVLGFVWWPGHRGWRRYALAAAAWLLVTASAAVINTALTDDDLHPWHDSVALFDIVGTLRWAPAMTDEELQRTLDGTPLQVTRDVQARARAAYSPVHGHFKVISDGFLQPPATPAQRAAIARAWRALVLDHPGAYLRHRLLAFRELLLLSDRSPELLTLNFNDGHTIEHLTLPVLAEIQRFEQRIARRCQPTLLFRPYIYLLVVVALLPLWIRQREALALAASGLISELGLYFVSPTPDFRYSIWLLVAALLVTAIVVARRVRNGSRADQRATAA